MPSSLAKPRLCRGRTRNRGESAHQGYRWINREEHCCREGRSQERRRPGVGSDGLSFIFFEVRRNLNLTCVQNSKNNQKTLFKPKPLTVGFVFSNLRDIALTSGNSVSTPWFIPFTRFWCFPSPCIQSQAKKVSIITKLLASCQNFEAKYIVRSLEGKLRIGNAERSVLVALAHAAVLAEKERSKTPELLYTYIMHWTSW